LTDVARKGSKPMYLHAIAPLFLVLAATGAAAAAPSNSNPAAVVAGTFKVEPSHTRVQFSVSHMGFTNWYGDFTGASGSLKLDPKNVGGSKLDITIPTVSIATTNAVLDGELKSADWFDAARFPSIHFVSTAVKQTGPATADISGDLTFHGVTRPVVLAARFNGAGVNPLSKAYTLGFDATTTITRSDFGVTKYVPLIGDDAVLRISAAFEAAR
jgi:polyisoprenoid-binding protein YceI